MDNDDNDDDGGRWSAVKRLVATFVLYSSVSVGASVAGLARMAWMRVIGDALQLAGAEHRDSMCRRKGVL
jgi:hypothetical protein